MKQFFSRIFKALTRVNPDIDQDVDTILQAVGGMDNLVETAACVTRLRLTLKDTSVVSKKLLQQHGAMGTIILDDVRVQIIYGFKANTYSQAIEARMNGE